LSKLFRYAGEQARVHVASPSGPILLSLRSKPRNSKIRMKLCLCSGCRRLGALAGLAVSRAGEKARVRVASPSRSLSASTRACTPENQNRVFWGPCGFHHRRLHLCRSAPNHLERPRAKFGDVPVTGGALVGLAATKTDTAREPATAAGVIVRSPGGVEPPLAERLPK
jgi:hypothetical protein